MNNTQLRAQLTEWNACCEAMDWLGERDSAQMWAECERADWLMWYAVHIVDRPTLSIVACALARTTLHLIPEGELRPLQTIELTERWANGDPAVTLAMVRASAAAASAASNTAATYAAAACAAAACASFASAAASAAAACAASFAASAAAASTYAHANLCAIVRGYWPECPVLSMKKEVSND